MDPQHLYKVSAPRSDMTFQPSRFWRSPDWESSTTQPRDGYIEETVLYAGDFDEVNIHLFPRVRTVRLRAADASASQRAALGLTGCPGMAALVFAPQSRRAEVEAFRPTIFTFEREGFTRVRKGEYVSWEPQTAIASETIPLAEALGRWNVEACYVDDLDRVVRALSEAGISFDEQT